jgi:hypothetical protein
MNSPPSSYYIYCSLHRILPPRLQVSRTIRLCSRMYLSPLHPLLQPALPLTHHRFASTCAACSTLTPYTCLFCRLFPIFWCQACCRFLFKEKALNTSHGHPASALSCASLLHNKEMNSLSSAIGRTKVLCRAFTLQSTCFLESWSALASNQIITLLMSSALALGDRGYNEMIPYSCCWQGGRRCTRVMGTLHKLRVAGWDALALRGQMAAALLTTVGHKQPNIENTGLHIELQFSSPTYSPVAALSLST